MIANEQTKAPIILCCMCGIEMYSNPTNMCSNCLHDRIDISSEINKKLTIHNCRTCHRWLGPPWQNLELESKELMTLCLRKINGLNKGGVKLIDASWIWTEPHSMRLKIKLTLQKEIQSGAIIQQSAIAEYVIRNQQCKMCEANFATGAWRAVVQVRQRVSHKRTFFYLEQLILKHEAHNDCLKIMTFKDGIDFYFRDKNQALRFISFLNECVPLKEKYSRKLLSADKKSNIADYRHSYIAEIAPICKDDLVLLPKELAAKQSNITPFVLVRRIGPSIFVIDPLTGEKSDIDCEKYWRYNFPAFLTSRQLVKFVVLSIEPVLVEHKPSARMKKIKRKAKDTDDQEKVQHQSVRSVSKLAEVTVARERDLGVNDNQFTCITHIGPLLSTGDIVLGYDISSLNYNTDEEQQKVLDGIQNLPDVILVRKYYDKERLWELKTLDAEVEKEGNSKETQAMEEDREHFFQQLESDREMRGHVNLFKKNNIKSKEQLQDDNYKYDEEEVQFDELLDALDHATFNENDEDDYEEEEEEQDNKNYIFKDKKSGFVF